MENQTWKYVKPLEDAHSIETFEKSHGISFPADLKEILRKYSGGRPPLKLYDTAMEKNKEFKTLLSFNRSDIENIYKYYPLESSDTTLIPFASDPAGNYFVIKDGKVFLWDHETDETIFLANTFTDFFKAMH